DSIGHSSRAARKAEGPDTRAVGKAGMSGTSYEKPDHWTLKARADGYPARSVYKLAEMQEKFRFLKPGMRVLDIGAAPGSWSLWVLRFLKGSGFLFALDLSPLAIKPSYGNLCFLQGDLYDPSVRSALAKRGPYGLIISDAAPFTSGDRTVDTGRSEAIVEAVIVCADEMLAQGGHLVAKLFQGGGERELLKALRGRFEIARTFKPRACRAESFETYLIGLGKKA
ncbi:MAG TPA: RlmE family RNA methyltransferase, partial [Magnetospirillaceae bacterium]|nr:RlmE family RNA methyltransferase [Magnetospirillaceae bacterium]